MVNKKYVENWINGDTFAWKIESKKYPEYNGRYFILTYHDLDYFKSKNILIFRFKITNNECIPQNQEEIDLLEDIKIDYEIYELAKEEYPEYMKEIQPDNYGYVYQYIVDSYNDRKTAPKKLVFIGNYPIKLIKNEFYPYNGSKTRIGFAWKYVDDVILNLYTLYNCKKFIGYTEDGNKEIYERQKEDNEFCRQILKWSEQLDGPNGKEILKSMGIDIDKETKKDSLTYVGKEKDNFEEK